MELKATRFERRDRVGVVSLHRPDRGNAWTGRMDTEVRWLLQEADADPEVRVIVITGSGPRFCVGGDSKALEGHVEKGGYDRGLTGDEATPGFGVAPEFDQVLASFFGLTKPIIASVNGAAAGIGMALTSFCDLRFASPGTKFTPAHGKLGLPAEYGLSWTLPRIVGTGRALDLLLTSRILLGDEAHRWGFVNQLHEPDQLLDATVDWAQQLATTVAGTSLCQTRWQVYRDLHRDVATSVGESIGLIDQLMGTPEYAEGIGAFVEKRPPQF